MQYRTNLRLNMAAASWRTHGSREMASRDGAASSSGSAASSGSFWCWVLPGTVTPRSAGERSSSQTRPAAARASRAGGGPTLRQPEYSSSAAASAVPPRLPE